MHRSEMNGVVAALVRDLQLLLPVVEVAEAFAQNRLALNLIHAQLFVLADQQFRFDDEIAVAVRLLLIVQREVIPERTGQLQLDVYVGRREVAVRPDVQPVQLLVLFAFERTVVLRVVDKQMHSFAEQR